MLDMSATRQQLLDATRDYFQQVLQHGEFDDPAYHNLLRFENHHQIGVAVTIVCFHRDTQNGGLSQSVYNHRESMADVLAAFMTIGDTALEMVPIIQEAWDLFKIRPFGLGDESDSPEDGEDDFDADDAKWTALDKRYFADRPPGPDVVEGAVLRYAAARPEYFALLAASAIVASGGAEPG